MKLSCIDRLVPGESLRDKARELRAWGFEGIEVLPSPAQDLAALAGELKRLPADAGVIPCVVTLQSPLAGRLMDPDGTVREAAAAFAEKRIELAGEVGVPTIVVFEYSPRRPLPLFDPYSPMPPDMRKRFVDTLGGLARKAESCGGTLLIEPINRYESRYVTTLAEAASVAWEVGSRSLAIMGDFFHMAIEEADIPRSIMQAGPFLRHTHLADSNRLLPGYGHTDFTGAFRALKDIGYSGFMSLECGVPGDPDVELPRCASRLARCWRAT